VAWRGNRRLGEAIADRFIAHGIAVALQEDVDGLLLDEGIIRPITGQYAEMQGSLLEQLRGRTSRVETPEYELAWGLHDETMRDELEKVIRYQDYFREVSLPATDPSEPQQQGVATMLSEAKIIELGKVLDVDLIVRGRILQYGLKRSPGPLSVVQMRLYVQNAITGELIWSNRGEIEVEAQSGLASQGKDLQAIVDQATQALVNTLMADFFGAR
jgi:hypothetical protein